MMKNIERLDAYKKDKQKLPGCPDGIYILVSGEAKIVNKFKYEDKDPALKELREIKKIGDFFGTSKIL
jgi:hypothetical protein